MTAEFTAAQLGKDHTLFVLAFGAATRQTYFLTNYQGTLKPHQISQVRDLVDLYESEYTRLRNDRSAILESALDGQDVETQLNNNRVETLLLSRQVRRRIFREILTLEQRKAHQAASRARREENKQRNERRNQQTDNQKQSGKDQAASQNQQ